MKCIKFLLESIWDGTKEEKKRGCCSDSSERRIWLVVEACVPASHTDLQAFCVRIQWGRGSEIWWSNKAGQIIATCHQNLFKLVWLEIAGVEPSYDIAFAREVGGKVGRVHDGCLFRPLCPSLPRTVCPQFRSGHKGEQINRRKLTSSLVQLEFDSKRNMHCSVVLTSIL